MKRFAYGFIALFALALTIVGGSGAAHAMPKTFGCTGGPLYDRGCEGVVNWTGVNGGVYATVFNNQETVGANANTFLGVWEMDYNTTACKALNTAYCYIKAGVVHYSSNNSDVAYIEAYLPGYSSPYVNSHALVSNDFGKNCADEVRRVNSDWVATVNCATTALNSTFTGVNPDWTISDTREGLQVIGSGLGTFTAPENDVTNSQYYKLSNLTWTYQTISGSVYTTTSACAKWKTAPAAGNNGGSLFTGAYPC